jgi:hypothetical protein
MLTPLAFFSSSTKTREQKYCLRQEIYSPHSSITKAWYWGSENHLATEFACKITHSDSVISTYELSQQTPVIQMNEGLKVYFV